MRYGYGIGKGFIFGISVVVFVLSGVLPAWAVQRFPRPDFTTDYASPELALPAPRWPVLEHLDVVVLFAALMLAVYLALQRRSRRGMFWIAVAGLAYFGFWRRGCVCAVGSVQNMALGWVDTGYVIPFAVIAFFTLPLLFALFSGRTFCSGVCPLGAIQELVVWRPVKLPMWLNHSLGMIPWVYLTLALLFAATGTGFLICRWDPFIGFFRMGAPFHMLIFGLLVLGTGLFIGRPYCRFLCPYGVLLGLMSKVSRRHVTITPDKCIQCRLCEDACPYGAIRKPLPAKAPETRRQGVRRLLTIMTVAPVVALAAAGAGYVFGHVLSPMNRDVALALELQQESVDEIGDMSLEREAFFTAGLPAAALYDDARSVQRMFAVGGAILGAVLALIACAKLLGLSIWRSRTDYEPDRALCFSCGRCFAYCPVRAE